MNRILLWTSFSIAWACAHETGSAGGGSGGTDAATESGTGATGGGTGSTGGALFGGSGGTVPVTRLGRACAVDAECGWAMLCATPDSDLFEGEGPPHGYCTFDCSEDASVCSEFQNIGSPFPVCVGMGNGSAYCLEGCGFGPTNLSAFDPDKCHGRSEIACGPIFDESGNFFQAACLPQCNSDADCGPDLGCNVRTGGCSGAVATGLPVGSVCSPDSDAALNECRGSCAGLVHESGQEPFTHICAESCTVGATPACGWMGDGSAPAACLFASTIIQAKGGPGIGDRGSCGQLCDDNCDCSNPELVCSAWAGASARANKDFFQRDGFCADPLGDDGGLDPGIACDVADANTDGD